MRFYHLLLLLFSFHLWSQSSFERGVSLFNKGQYDQAKVQFEKEVTLHTSDLKSLEYLGDIHCHLKQWEQAVPYYQKLTKLNPKDAEYCYKYGGALGMQAKESNKVKALFLIEDVIKAFEQTLILNPSHIGARWALIEIYLQLPGMVGGSESKANRYAAQLLRISPVDGYLAYGHIEEYFKRYRRAEKQYQKAIEEGNSLTTYQKLADLYQYKMDQPEKAKQILALYNEKNKS